ncbi:MAG: DHA2 family efflux MFS transporter permease subunit [Zoogloeaceae bacterium]|jgi:DHA2 family multidrug resistance protein|nr:DHA2 family efflux MFS transporter permease subunit [Zoogloeaceae bacterium]
MHGAGLVLLTLSLGLATFMQVLDTSIANVSLPSISGDLAVSPNQGTWVITSFAVSNAIALPLTGWLSRRIGEVRLFVLSTLLFTLASFLCGLAPTLPILIAFRVLQGAVAGPMVPLSQSLLLNNYPLEKKAIALSLWSMTVVVAPIMGPIMGGWITDNLTWPWIFYINIPIGLLSAGLAWQLLRNRESATVHQPIDAVGLALLILGVGALQLLLDKGNDLDWFESNQIILLAVVAVIALVFLVAWELTEKHPVIDLHLYSQRNFLVGSVILSIGYLVFFANVVILPLWLQTQMGYTATWAGLAAAPVGILPIFLSALIGKNMHRLDLRVWASFAFGIFAFVSFWSSSFNSDVPFLTLVMPRFVQGFGVACFFVPLTALTLSGLPPHMLASATGLSNFTRIVAGSFGTSLSITLWDRRATLHHATLSESITPYSPAADQALGALNDAGIAAPADTAMLDNIINQQAFMQATNDIFWLSGCFFIALMIFVWAAKPPRHPTTAAPIAHAE